MRDILLHALGLLKDIEVSSDGVYQSEYCYKIKTLLNYIQKDELCDVNYSSHVVLFQRIKDDEFMAQTTFDDLKILLTCCHKGEHFSKGMFGKLLEQGIVRTILERMLQELDSCGYEKSEKKKRALYGKRLYSYIQKEIINGASVKIVADKLTHRDDDSNKVWTAEMVTEHIHKYEGKLD